MRRTWRASSIAAAARLTSAGRCVAGHAFALVATLHIAPALCAADDEPGKRQFLTSCGTCHTAEPGAAHRQGPNLLGVVGRRAGTAADFAYSSALAAGAFVWDEKSLERWIADPQAMLPGTSMAYRQRDPAKRRAIVAYLKSLKP